MELQKIEKAMHFATFGKNISRLKEVKDLYEDINYLDLSQLNVEELEEEIEIFNFINSNQDFNFESLSSGYYSENYKIEELKRFCIIYAEDLKYQLENYQNENFILRYSDFEQC